MKYFFQFKNIALASLAFGLVSLTAKGAPSTLANVAGQEDIRDIRPPIHIAAPFPWLPWTVGALSVLAVGVVSWKLLRRTRRKHAYEIALERLDIMRAFMCEDDTEPFCLAVSDIVREFIEEVLPARAMHRTTNEFLHDISLSDLQLAPHRDTLENFLQHCDLAKFARWSLSIPQMEAMLSSAKDFVIDLGKPKPEKASPPAENSIAAASYSPIS